MNTHIEACVPMVVALALSALACSKGAEEPHDPPGASQGDEMEATPAEHQSAEWGATLTEGQILEVLHAVDTAEIEQAQVARSKAQSPRVREFAEHMIEQHEASLRAGEQLATSSGVMRSASAVTMNLQPKAAEVLQTLNTTEPGTFDHAYMMSQIQQHDEVLKVLTEQVVPAATSPAVRELATKAQAMVQQHLEQARTIQP